MMRRSPALTRPHVLPAAAGVLAMQALAGCARPEVEKSIGFDAGAHAAWRAPGRASIAGEGFLRRPNGWLARCSGGTVYLAPASPYFREWVEIHRSGGRVANAAALDRLHDGVVRKTQCDATGRFAFEALPAQRWLVVTRISYQGVGWNADMTLAAEVETKAGEATQVILSNPNRI
ncbi:MAG: carboxypeptidase-like regulatory domain-containing protein [Hyphomicrobiales bacterium]|uniref:carboxypeptidase-like regulatory domain-containing protein n=1 Tax=Rhabdaerophilum calidifontis TaxID=2604328 RepID=UPI00123AE6C7|nr:carboxypeptidase-like regulatory domain-containing protein [Rhabdaerophilum calidifontis]MCA1999111.1 carboxypeptidase-like regulatory domain-containing protein [Hyphomicrobiales bacterium]